MLGLRKQLLLMCFLFLSFANAHGAMPSLIKGGETIFKAGKYQKVATLTTIAKADLSYATKADNVHGLLDLAVQENRIDTISLIQLGNRFSAEKNGDRILLACLKITACQPEKFLESIRTSELHAQVALRQPGLNQIKVAHAVGEVIENLMVRYFQYSGWKQIPGQIGRQGIDGLFVKMKDGVVKEVLVVESKYNNSQLGTTKHGTQMSDQWVRRKIEELRTRYPDEKTYKDIERFADAGTYRAILWNVKVEDNSLKVGLTKVKSKDGSVSFREIVGSEDEALSTPFKQAIRMDTPQNRFEQQVVSWYQSELARYGKMPSDF